MANVILLVASALAPSAGHEAVMCPHTSCYFDYTQCLRDDPALYPWFTHRRRLVASGVNCARLD